VATVAGQEAFWRAVAPYAAAVHAAIPSLWPQTLLVQWGVETGYNPAGYPPYNLAGISPGGHLAAYRSYGDFVRAYIATISSPLYAAVRQAPDVVDQLYALGESPWAAGHYHGPGQRPGQTLVDVYLQHRGYLDSLAGTIPVSVGGITAAVPTWVGAAVVGIPLAALIIADLRRL